MQNNNKDNSNTPLTKREHWELKALRDLRNPVEPKKMRAYEAFDPETCMCTALEINVCPNCGCLLHEISGFETFYCVHCGQAIKKW